MSADIDGTDGRPPIVTTYVPQSNDLEVIVTLLELAAIDLTPAHGATFTFDELISQANRIGGGEVVLDKADATIVLPFVKFLRKTGKHLSLT